MAGRFDEFKVFLFNTACDLSFSICALAQENYGCCCTIVFHLVDVECALIRIY